MSLKDEVDALLDKYQTTPLDAYDQVRQLLREACAKDGKCDPTKSPTVLFEGFEAYDYASRRFEQLGYLSAAETLLLEWWDDFGWRQLNENRCIYRAGIALKLTTLYLRVRYNGLALRWCLYTQAADILSGHETGRGAGKHYLRTVFGMTESEVEELDRIAQTCRAEVIEQENDWTKPPGFPEV